MAKTKKDIIVEKAIELIAREGLRSLTQRKVAANAGTSLASVTYYFPKLRDLINAAFSKATSLYIQKMWEERDDALASRKSLPQAYLGTLLDEKDNPYDHVLVVFEMFLDAMHNEDSRQEVEAFIEKSREFVVPWVDSEDASYVANNAIIGASLSFLAAGYSKEVFLEESEQMLDYLGISGSITDKKN